MSFFAKAGTLNFDTAPAGFTDQVIGFQPKIIFIIGINQLSNTLSTQNGNGGEFSIGWGIPASIATVSSNLYNSGMFGTMAQQPYYVYDSGTPASGKIQIALSLITNGFRVTTTKNTAGLFQYGYLALGGTDLEAVNRNDTTSIPSVTGIQTITSGGVANPNLAILNFSGATGAIPFYGNSSSHPGMAFIDPTQIFSVATSANKRVQTQGAVLNLTASAYCKALFSAFNAANLQLNWTNIVVGGSAQSAIDYIFMRMASGFKYEIGEFQLPATAGAFSMNFADPLLNPSAVMFLSAPTALEGEANIQNDAKVSWGWVDGLLNMYTTDFYKQFSVSNFGMAHRNDFVFQNITALSTVSEKLAVTGLFGGGMNLDLSGTAGLQSKVGYLAFGGGTAPALSTSDYGFVV